MYFSLNIFRFVIPGFFQHDGEAIRGIDPPNLLNLGHMRSIGRISVPYQRAAFGETGPSSETSWFEDHIYTHGNVVLAQFHDLRAGET